jgi:hypothetical protein
MGVLGCDSSLIGALTLRDSTCFANIDVADTVRFGVVNLVLIKLDTSLVSPPFASPHHQGLATYAATAFVSWVVNFGSFPPERGSWGAWL